MFSSTHLLPMLKSQITHSAIQPPTVQPDIWMCYNAEILHFFFSFPSRCQLKTVDQTPHNSLCGRKRFSMSKYQNKSSLFPTGPVHTWFLGPHNSMTLFYIQSGPMLGHVAVVRRHWRSTLKPEICEKDVEAHGPDSGQ